MVAVYPTNVKTFSYRQDFTQIVEAGDVNVAYDEIAALETTLGTNPQWDTIDGVVNKWSTVGARISAVRKGVSKPFVNVSAHNFTVAYGSGKHYVSWTNKSWDTHGMWTGGSYLTCKRSGVYTFDIYMRWHADNNSGDSGQPVFNRNGALEISLTPVGGTGDMVHQDGFYPIGWQKSTHQAASITMPWTAGQSVQMWVNQTSLTTPITATAFCSITYHRDAPTTNNL